MKLLFIGDLNSTFIKKDFDTLSRFYEITQISPPCTGWTSYVMRVKRAMRDVDAALGWFAGWHTLPMVFYAKKYKKSSIIVVGGYDAVSFPEIGYGAFSNIKERIPAKYVLKNADLVLPVSNYLRRQLIKNARIKENKIFPIPTGYNSEFWKPNGKKENMVLSVAVIKNMKRIKVKGLDTFVKAARYVPDAKFRVIGAQGKAEKYLKSIASDNVEILDFVPHRELLKYYQRAKVYVQLSISEGLPNTLCEAMLTGAIPVGTKRGGIPEVMGNIGFYVPYNDVKATAQAIKKALNSPDILGVRARERILTLFPETKRENLLGKMINIAVLMKYSPIIKKVARAYQNEISITTNYISSKLLELTIEVTK